MCCSLIDEMKVMANLVLDRTTRELISFTDLGVPCIKSPVKSPASLAKPGLAGLSRLFARLARKVWPGKPCQARPRPGFHGHHGHNSLAFPALKFLCQAFLAFLAWKTWPQKRGHHGHVVQGQGVLAKLMLYLSI